MSIDSVFLLVELCQSILQGELFMMYMLALVAEVTVLDAAQ
jgi:hypothetical protein